MNGNYNVSKKDVKDLASQVETLAKEVQNRIDNGADYYLVANELIGRTTTFVFAMGEVYAVEQVGTGKTAQAKVVRKGNPNYHNVRDSRGRFTKK